MLELRSPYVQAPRGQGRRQVEPPSAGLGRAFPALPGVASAGHRTRLRDVLGVVAVGGPTHRPDGRAREQMPGALRVLPWAAAGAGQSGRMDAPRAPPRGVARVRSVSSPGARLCPPPSYRVIRRRSRGVPSCRWQPPGAGHRERLRWVWRPRGVLWRGGTFTRRLGAACSARPRAGRLA